MSGLQDFLKDTRRKDKHHSWSKPYAPSCIKSKCDNKPYFDGEIYFSLCLGCLEKEQLGPFKPKFIKEDYSTVFWLGDWENKQSKEKI